MNKDSRAEFFLTPHPPKTCIERFLAESTVVFGPPSAAPRLLNDPMSDVQLTVGKAIIEEVIRLRTPGLFFHKVVATQGLTLSTGEHVPRKCVVCMVCGSFACVSIVFDANKIITIHTPYLPYRRRFHRLLRPVHAHAPASLPHHP